MPAILMLIAAMCLLTPAAAIAQVRETSDVHLRNDCRRAAQVLRTGHPAPRMEWAFSVIPMCDESGPAVVAGAWRSAATFTVEHVDQLARATRAFDSRAVVEALMDVARGRSYPPDYRVHAMALLYSYAEPGTYLHVEDLTGQGVRWPRLTSVSHDHAAEGTRDALGNLVSEVLDLLRDILRTESRTPTGMAAETILRILSLSGEPTQQ